MSQNVDGWKRTRMVRFNAVKLHPKGSKAGKVGIRICYTAI